jgi:serine/threonine protein phosphatase PrpC
MGIFSGATEAESETGIVATAKVRPGIELGNLSDVGCQRDHNEDSYGYAEPEDEEIFRRKGRLVVIADGMGGRRGGEVASSMAVGTVCATYLASGAETPDEALVAAFQAAHQSLQDFAREHPEVQGMGTTCIAAVLRDAELTWAHVGDSRLYLVRESAITQLTEDQTVVQRLLRQGLLAPEEAVNHPDRGVLTTALGASQVVEIEVPETPIALLPGDFLLFCTDGLHDLVQDDEMASAATADAPAAACQALVELAKSRGGFDNITIQILRFEGKDERGAS